MLTKVGGKPFRQKDDWKIQTMDANEAWGTLPIARKGFALIANASLEARLPFLHFFDG